MASRSFAVLSLLVPLVFAQSSNPYIPSDSISAPCASYLTALNNNSAFVACTTPFTTALQQFAPGASGASSDTITTALKTLCQSDAFSACPQSTVTNQLGAFYAACEAELTSKPNLSVKTTYDVLYALVPIRQAICSKNDTEGYCVTHLSSSSGTGVVALADPEASQQHTLLTNYLYTTTGSGAVVRRGASGATALAPNTTTYQNTNLLFMFLNPSMPASTLCTTCTRNFITPYIDFESACPYGPGLSNSLLLAGQVPLYNNITTKCGSSFLSGAVQAAGGLSSGLLSGAPPLVVGQELSAAVSLILGIAAFAAASL